MEMMRQTQPNGVSWHRFHHFLLKAAGGSAGRQTVRSQDLVGQRREAGEKERAWSQSPLVAHVQMPTR